MSANLIGTIGWIDLSVPAAGPLRDFYSAVTGWKTSEVDMGGYSDYCMNTPAEGSAVAGICHARGPNEGLPSQWLIYITVADVEASAAEAQKRGGKLLRPVKDMGSHGRFCVIQDPAGAVAGLYQPA